MINIKSSDLIAHFPPEFAWGVATSAFQIEGAANEDGKGLSIWDTFCRQPGAIADASNGDIACEHYHRLEQDLDLIAELKVNTYRFSISWPRVQPDGAGAWNEKGMEFYARMIDGLIARGIAPYVTLNHWDLPEQLQAGGGWASRDTVQHFVQYALEIARRFGDRVDSIVTHNEPWVVSILGNESGIFAPGIKDRAVAMQVSHHLLLSHGLAVQALKAAGCKCKLGIVLNLSPIHSATNSAEDIAKARLDDGLLVRWYMDPLFKGRYPQDVMTHLGTDAPRIEAGDMEAIAVPMDFLGVNYYTRTVASATGPWDNRDSGRAITGMGWEIYPEGLTELLLRLARDYAVPPMYVTENGGSFDDVVEDGKVHDAERTDYLVRHIAAVADAMRQGVNMGGYMVWSLLDNFEWASGYEKRFGIVHVDYQTQERTLKDSAMWYRDFLSRKKIRPQKLASATSA